MAIFAILTLVLSAAGFLIGFPWGLAAFLAGIGLLVYVGYVLSKMEYVEHAE